MDQRFISLNVDDERELFRVASDFRYAQVLAEKLIGWAIITAFFAWLWL